MVSFHFALCHCCPQLLPPGHRLGVGQPQRPHQKQQRQQPQADIQRGEAVPGEQIISQPGHEYSCDEAVKPQGQRVFSDLYFRQGSRRPFPAPAGSYDADCRDQVEGCSEGPAAVWSRLEGSLRKKCQRERQQGQPGDRCRTNRRLAACLNSDTGFRLCLDLALSRGWQRSCYIIAFRCSRGDFRRRPTPGRQLCLQIVEYARLIHSLLFIRQYDHALA